MSKLIFVYNADSGYFNVIADIAHKIFSPSTYPCSLCDLTYGVFKINPEWDLFIKNAPIPFEFLHKDEFLANYKALSKMALPTILLDTNGQIVPFITADSLSQVKSVQHLIDLILEKLPMEA